MSFSIRQGDTAPPLSATLKDADGDAVDLTGETVRFHMSTSPGTTAKVDAAATVTDAANGRVRYDWQSGDTDTAGTFYGEFEVGDQTYPNGVNDYIQVHVSAEIA